MTSSIYNISKGGSARVHVNKARPVVTDDASLLSKSTDPTSIRFNSFWTLMEALKSHGYLRAAMSLIGRSAVGAWWTVKEYEDYGGRKPDMHRRRLIDFYMMTKKNWDNIKDYYTFAAKLFIGVMYLRYFGQVAYYIVRDDEGRAVGLDHLVGMVVPNVDSSGNFKEVAFVQYPTSNPRDKVEFNNPRDIVFIVNPDFEGSPTGGTDIESLADFALPLDIYLQAGARDYMKNRDKPEVIYQLPTDVSDEAFDAFVEEVETRWAGPTNIGRSPITIQGELKVTELRELPKELPYQTARDNVREEALAVSGVSGSKLGLVKDMTNSNFRESRREFHESMMIPLLRVIEYAFYEQIHVREFNYPGWMFKFKAPDFLTAVEKATVHLRYQQMGGMNPNEIRDDLGMRPRTDPGGEMFADQTGYYADNPQGNPPEGREDEPDSPDNVGEPDTEVDEPARGDNHDDEVRDTIKALRDWRSFAIGRAKRKRKIRPYESPYLPEELTQIIQPYLDGATTAGDVVAVFDEVLGALG